MRDNILNEINEENKAEKARNYIKEKTNLDYDFIRELEEYFDITNSDIQNLIIYCKNNKLKPAE